MNIVFDDATVPSRGARLSTRARWAADYLRRFCAGSKATRKELELAIRWIEELVERGGAPTEELT